MPTGFLSDIRLESDRSKMINLFGKKECIKGFKELTKR